MKLKKVYIINKEMRMERTNQNTNNDHDDGDEVVPPSGPQITIDIDEVVRFLRTLWNGTLGIMYGCRYGNHSQYRR